MEIRDDARPRKAKLAGSRIDLAWAVPLNRNTESPTFSRKTVIEHLVVPFERSGVQLSASLVKVEDVREGIRQEPHAVPLQAPARFASREPGRVQRKGGDCGRLRTAADLGVQPAVHHRSPKKLPARGRRAGRPRFGWAPRDAWAASAGPASANMQLNLACCLAK